MPRTANRDTAPTKKADDAILIDSSELSFRRDDLNDQRYCGLKAGNRQSQ